MEHWEFLLQKEGDRSWLPLDSPDVEILEGRYRVVARSNHSNAAIDIRIAHLATEEAPPKRRIQKRSCRTNHDGLMVVIPFTHLEAGQWELCCSPVDLMSDLMAGAQPHALKLQVVAHSLEEDWEPDWTAPSSTSSDIDSVSASQSPSEPGKLSQDANEINHGASVDLESSTSSTGAPPPLTVAAAPQQMPLPPEVAEILGASMDRLFQIAEQMSEQLVDEVLQDFELTTIADTPVSTEALEANTPVPEPATIASPSATNAGESTARANEQHPVGHTLVANQTFVLSLDQAAFIATRGEVMTLSGHVAIAPAPSVSATHQVTPSVLSRETDASDPWESDLALNVSGATAQEIQLCLRDPQSLQVLVSDRQPLPSQPLPSAFNFSFVLPDTFTTHLVLGEVLLCGVMAGKEGTPVALVTQAFSITVDPNGLVGELSKLHDALATEIEDEERIDLPLELSSRLQEQAAPSVDLSFLDWSVVEPATERSPRFPSLAGQPLPPQLYRPDPNQVRSKALDLPAFKLAAEPEATVQADLSSSSKATPAAPSSSEAIAANADALETGTSEAVPHPSLVAAAPTPSEVSATEAVPDQNWVDMSVQATASDASVTAESVNNDTNKPPLELPSPTQMSFQSLKLRDRFLTRLTSLATDTELTALLKANIAPGQPLTPPQTAASAADVRSLTEEIVVDDELQPLERRRNKPATVATDPAAAVGAAPSEKPPNSLILPADDPVPTPTLDVATGELTAGKSVNIRVKLPNLLPRIYVKLWVTDRQTRSLLDGPRWLVDFLPNGLGDLEAMAPLTVPFGSVELRFEAIAVEMHTQRESHKATVDRVVIPPDLPSVSLDDFHP